MFKFDGKFYEIISKLTDLVILNILFLICCIPIVTIGAATTALYGVTKKMTKKSEGYIVKNYFKQFKENFKQSTIMWLILFVAGMIPTIDLYIINNMSKGGGQTILMGFALMAVIIVFFVFLYAMALQSTFENTVKNTIKNAFLMGVGHFPWTLLIVFVAVSPFISLGVMGNYWSTELFVMMLIWFSGSAYINSYIFNHIFEKYGAIPLDENL